MKIIKTPIKDLLLIYNQIHKDKRGYFKELLIEKSINKEFKFIVMSYSKKNVIRGLHIQKKNTQGKYVSVLKGKIFDVAVDLRPKSKTFGHKYSTILSEKNSKSLYIPEGFAHGFCTLENNNYVIYSCTEYRNKQSEIGIKFNDKDLNIKWPIKYPILSDKDKQNISFKKYLQL